MYLFCLWYLPLIVLTRRKTSLNYNVCFQMLDICRYNGSYTYTSFLIYQNATST